MNPVVALRGLHLLALAALSACPASQVATAPDGGAPAREAAAKAAPVAGWAVYLDKATVVIPDDPARPPTRLPGIWIVDDADPAAVSGLLVGADLTPPAACDGAAAAKPAFIDARPLASGTWEVTDMDDNTSDCEGESYWPVGVVGGVVFLAGATHMGCQGMNIYGAASDARALTTRGWTPPAALPGALERCEPDGAFVETTPSFAPTGPCRPLPGGWTEATEDDAEATPESACEDCRSVGTSEVWRLANGRVTRLRSHIYSAGGGPSAVATAPVTPASCPSAADPCGDPRRFATVPDIAGADPVDPSELFWIATDGASALVVTTAGWQTWAPGAEAPAREGDLEDMPMAARRHVDLGALVPRACAALRENARE
ncbi:MAG: hypothetical protein H6745_16480 [Deltaproteobacteria bacterium]|nr:hypothetical protein [Deltaproteobacteria bacterium]